jgi:filamentous hemagglutinin family protein
MKFSSHHPCVVHRCLVTGAAVFYLVLEAPANPTGLTVAAGSANAQQNGSQLTVTASQNAQLNWQSFNIAAGETTIFKQPSAHSIVWNRINDQNPSQIFGNLQANGVVVLLNSSGFYFGPNSFVSAAGLVVSTAQYVPPENCGNGWQFNGPPPLKSIVNYGKISVGQNGSAFLIADQIENHGTIEAPGGTIGLAAGQTVLLSERPDGRGMNLQVKLPQGSVDNHGNLIADAGTIALNAKVINQDGLLQANSVQDQNGVIELVAADQLTLGANSTIQASGDNSSSGSAGGSVTLKSENDFADVAGSKIILTGGTHGGNGGNVEISAPNIQSLNSAMDANAQTGWYRGEFFLDPVNIILGTTSANGVPINSSGTGTVAYNSAPNTLNLYVGGGGSFNNFSQIILQATGNIYVGNGTVNASGVFSFAANPGITWNLSSSTGNPSGQVTLEAGGNIVFGNKSQILDANNWSVTLDAGYDFVNNVVQPGVGNIYLNGGAGLTGSGSIQMAGSINSTAINLTAGQNILVGTGYVITTGGGGIDAHALSGSIDTGSDAQGYHFNTSASSLNNAYDLSHGLGGISTEAGGDVNLTAGGNVTTVLPISSGTGKVGYVFDGTLKTTLATGVNTDFGTAGSGAYGRLTGQKGNVSVVAGGNVIGNYLVANGTGSIYAGVLMDANGNPETDSLGNYVLGTTGSAGLDNNKKALALSLISGGWNVTAAQNIVLQEVRNPNGMFDVSGGATYKHYFDYALNDYVNLTAANLVQLGASSSTLPRSDTLNVPVIYPSILNISAGAGGVSLIGDLNDTYNQLILFPSAQGSLTINTTKNGPLIGTLSGSSQDFNLIVSDSGSSQYLITPYNPTPFALNDHAASPIHLGNPTPITLNLSGDMDFVLLGAPEAAQINVGGNMNNSRFQGMNLSADPNQSDQVQVREINGSIGTATVNPGLTSINVTGDINNRGDFTSVDLSKIPGTQTPDLAYLAQAVNNSLSSATLTTTLFYNPATQTMTYQNVNGKSLASVLKLLQNLTVQKMDAYGNPLWLDPPYDTIPDTEPVSVLNTATAQALVNQYNADNLASALPAGATPPNGTYGYFIGGGGRLNVSARNMDLGTAAGIQSEGVSLYTIGGSYPLAKKADITKGADISVNLTGNLDMYSTSIASVNGGNISIVAGGDVNAGSAELTVNSTSARGIFSTSQGNVSVTATGDINLNGSRIGTYNGGDITVESLDGNVNVGNGGNGSVVLYDFFVNPVTYGVTASTFTLHGSGIVATTFPDSFYAEGNILVESPNGTISANQAGIVQDHFNIVNNLDATVIVLAGYELQDAQGHRVSAENLASGTPTLALSTKNIVSLGSTIQLIPAGADSPVSLTQILDANGNPLMDTSGNSLYVKTSDASRQIVEFVGNKIQSYLDATGNNVNIVEPVDANNLPVRDSHGNAILVIGRNIDISGSGVIAQNAALKATGSIYGLIFARGNIDVNAQQNVNVTALAQGTADVSGSSLGNSTIIGFGGITASGDSSGASLMSNNQISGGTSGQTGFAQGTAANAASAAASSNDSSQTAENSTTTDSTDDLNKNKKPITLAQKVGRVTVLLPTKIN